MLLTCKSCLQGFCKGCSQHAEDIGGHLLQLCLPIRQRSHDLRGFAESESPGKDTGQRGRSITRAPPCSGPAHTATKVWCWHCWPTATKTTMQRTSVRSSHPTRGSARDFGHILLPQQSCKIRAFAGLYSTSSLTLIIHHPTPQSGQ